MQQRGLRGGIGVVLLVLAFAAGTNDSPVRVAPNMDLALPAGEGAGGKLLDEALIVTAQALEYG
ncbi:hypothetical protein EDD91_0097 [Streptomyces sp. KS 21]|nr:hypothetical protein EDD91_0097 [Streptomyces sp. KS 21]